MKDVSSGDAKVDWSGERMVAAKAAMRVVAKVSPQVETKDGHLGETWASKLVEPSAAWRVERTGGSQVDLRAGSRDAQKVDKTVVKTVGLTVWSLDGTLAGSTADWWGGSRVALKDVPWADRWAASTDEWTDDPMAAMTAEQTAWNWDVTLAGSTAGLWDSPACMRHPRIRRPP